MRTKFRSIPLLLACLVGVSASSYSSCSPPQDEKAPATKFEPRPHQDNGGHIYVARNAGELKTVPFTNDRALGRLIQEVSNSGGGTLTFPPGVYGFDEGITLKNIRNVHLVGQKPCVFRLRHMSEFGKIRVSKAYPVTDKVLAVNEPGELRPGAWYQIFRPTLEGNRRLEFRIGEITGNEAALDKVTVRMTKQIEKDMYVLPHLNFFDFYLCGDMSFTDIEFDGNFDTRSPKLGGNRFYGHTMHCGIVFRNPYHDKKDRPAPRPATRNVTIDGCTFRNLLGRGFVAYNVDGVTAKDCHFEAMAAEGLEIDHRSARAVVSGCTFTRNVIGMRLNDCVDTTVSHCVIRDCSTGIHLTNALDEPEINRRLALTGNVISNVSIGVTIDRGFEQVTLTGNIVSNCADVGFNVHGDGVVCTGNSILGARNGGIRSAGRRLTVEANQIEAPPNAASGWKPVIR